MTDDVPERQRLLVELINTLHRPDSDDALRDERADAWLARQLGPGRHADLPPGPAADRELRDLVRLREGLRQLARMNNGQDPERDVLEEAAQVLATRPLTVHLATPGSAAGLRPAPADGATAGPTTAGPAAAVFAEAATAYLAESAAGTWKRVKACANADCQFAFIDSSRNASRRWCDMSGCGNQAKQRGYRRRHSAE